VKRSINRKSKAFDGFMTWLIISHWYGRDFMFNPSFQRLSRGFGNWDTLNLAR